MKNPFKSSEVPDLVFHGTSVKFDRFEYKQGKRNISGLYEYDTKANGFFFSPLLEDAKTYGPNVAAAYLNIENVFIAPGASNWDSDLAIKFVEMFEPFIEHADASDAWRWYGRLKIADWSWLIKISDADPDYPEWPYNFVKYGLDWRLLDDPRVVTRIREFGFDGTAVSEPNDISGFSWFVFSPDQIKFVWLEEDA